LRLWVVLPARGLAGGQGGGEEDGDFFDVQNVERRLAKLRFFQGEPEQRRKAFGGDKDSRALDRLRTQRGECFRRDDFGHLARYG
jgi:hypothetical protein